MTWARPHLALDEDPADAAATAEALGIGDADEVEPADVLAFPPTMRFAAAGYRAALDRVEQLMAEHPWPRARASSRRVRIREGPPMLRL
ncbi:MAG: hypothetical protein ACTH9T_05090 [Mycetocola reblochoni]|uniref:Uncharacterized protein n=2 Tax=Mycetocola reblochoni TaxID=331618 RepID=A0A1R4IVC7_9MICO|nr:hypothetical protein [Mycetocola reblochoni]RLP71011.1 hypothetical protein D9V30_00870 [Mycetocola reblochoni]SJN23668.1 hypothetical protein FM119_03750 [Mycetocola reblochoni REB411]